MFSKAKNSVSKRCRSDELTKGRLKYGFYYQHFSEQRGSHVWLDGQELILLSSNDYLGLNEHPKVIEAGTEALKKWGSSSTGSRSSNGGRAYHRRLEEKLAKFLGKEDCHIHSAGYLSCMSAVQAFVQRGELILVDKNVHSALWTGIASTMGRVEKFSHNNPASLEKELSFEDAKAPKFMIIEGVYSMEGHLCKGRELVDIASKYNCFNILDDAHGIGVMGNEGRGTADHLGITDDIDIICGSLSKSLASTGGFVAGDKAVIEYLRTHSKQTIFSAAISPSQAACAEAALEVMQSEPEHLERLWSNTERYKAMVHEIGLDTWDSESPAVPIVIGEKVKCYKFWHELKKLGVYTTAAVCPAVPPKKDMIRTAISAKHSDEDLEKIGEAMAIAAKRIL